MQKLMKRTKKGFTLVELIIVIAVMAILVAIAIPTVSSVVNNANRSTYNTNAATIESAIKTYLANESTSGTTATASADNIKKAIIDGDIKIAKDYTFYYHKADNCVLLFADDADYDDTGATPAAGVATFKITFDSTKDISADSGYVTVADFTAT